MAAPRNSSGASALFVLLVGAAAPAGGQAPPLVYLPLDSATVVRLHLTAGGTATGRLVEPFGPDSTRFVYCPFRRPACTARSGGWPRATAASDVRLVDVRRGNHAKRGAALGAGATLGIAAAVCVLTDIGGCDPSGGGFFSYVALPAALAGAGVGALVGGSLSAWQRAP